MLPGANGALERLGSAFRLGLATSAARPVAQTVLEKTGWKRFFPVVVSADEEPKVGLGGMRRPQVPCVVGVKVRKDREHRLTEVWIGISKEDSLKQAGRCGRLKLYVCARVHLEILPISIVVAVNGPNQRV